MPYKKSIPKNCWTCGQDILVRKNEVKDRNYCSHKCHHKQLKIDRIGSGNGMWKGDDAGYFAIHMAMRNKLEKPTQCECCGKNTSKLDMANISGEYKRIEDDWEFLCRRCHMKKDGRLDHLTPGKGIVDWIFNNRLNKD